MVNQDVVGRRLILVFLLHILPLSCLGLIVQGELKTKEDWTFIARYCYRNKLGSIQYYFKYPKSLCCQKAILYYDIQWPKVYKVPSKCESKLDVTIPENNQILLLSPNEFHSGCSNSGDYIICKGGREFVSSRSRWWYVVISNCGKAEGVQIEYKLEMTNGRTFWTKHFSADENKLARDMMPVVRDHCVKSSYLEWKLGYKIKNILPPNIFFLVIYFVILGTTVLLSMILKSRQLFHYTYKLFIWSVFFEFVSLIFNVAYYVSYGKSGHPRRSIQIAERGFHSVSDIIFLVMLILLAKGWTVTRGRISSGGQVKLGVFCTLYAIAYIALFIYEANVFDPGEVLYLYESPAGVGLCILRTIAWVWFCYGTFFTLKHYPQKYLFYYPFWFFYTLWFLSGPVFVLVSTYLLEAWIRAQIVNGIDRAVIFVAHIFFLLLTRPSAANKNFPYHVRTSQVGIVEDNKLNQNFAQHAYAQSAQTFTDTPEAMDGTQMKTFSDISALFRASASPPPTINSMPISQIDLNGKPATNGSLSVNGPAINSGISNGGTVVNFHLFQASAANVPNGSSA